MSYYGRLPTGYSIGGSISPVGETDSYRVTLVPGLTYSITAQGSSSGNGTLVDPHMALTTLSGRQLAYDDDISSSNYDAQIVWTAPAGGSSLDYFVNVAENGDNASGTYKLTVSAGYASNYADRVVGSAYGDAIAGMDGNDQLAGGNGNDYLYGQNGNDYLMGLNDHDYLSGATGNDSLRGGTGSDRLVGGAGADQLVGGSGADRFIFYAGDSGRYDYDAIMAGDGGLAFDGIGAAAGDVIDLSAIDANPYVAGNQAFQFSSTLTTGTAYLTENTRGDTVLMASTDADSEPELVIQIRDGAYTASQYAANDFIL
ncbi:hypothetical protein DRW48_02375 [Paracoccus suum]|uniref:Calcium-binding protein n=1 Tax=Paracoccus suum TaxID=2259340 RepID=A0A344PH31_9RHOB|nr:hypothetical protein [Paracoccus suum]AXC48686.1 hypothetical protein DRW48_02375 [Paracoccus suum]